MDKFKNKKNIFIISIVVLFLIFGLFLILKPSISFKKEYKEIEFGMEYDYSDMIEKIKPKDAEIIYPEFKASEVGNYKLTFKFKKNDKVYEDEFSFKIVDTLTPKLTLYFMDEDINVRLNDSNFNVLSNIHYIQNLSEEALLNKVQLDNESFNKLISDAKELNKILNNREIVEKKDIKKYDVQNNGVFYTTDLDVSKVGKYSINVCVIDENYNVVETNWVFNVVESDQLLNSGGSVTCNYIGEDLSGNEAYSVSSVENYTYDPFKLVKNYEIVTVMTFSDDYDTDKNIQLMLSELNNTYGEFNDIDGVNVSISNNSNIVTTSIFIDLDLYDKEKDVLEILVNKSNSEIDMQSVIDKADVNKYVCTIK